MLKHYIIVRNDLPLGVLSAMTTHAAGESAFLFKEDSLFRGATAVVLEVPDELSLFKAAKFLRDYGLAHIEVQEHGGPFDGQLMALGLIPTSEEWVHNQLASFPLLKRCASCVDSGEPVELLKRLRQWDHLDGAADGPFWKGEIDNVLRAHVDSENPDDTNQEASTQTPDVAMQSDMERHCGDPTCCCEN